jgi:hypothetical protein
LKALLRKAAERTGDALWDRIGALIKEFTPQECANFFAAAGYEPRIRAGLMRIRLPLRLFHENLAPTIRIYFTVHLIA